jgi:protein-S-isoprenylcysteine O-methyltransferase Ste14
LGFAAGALALWLAEPTGRSIVVGSIVAWTGEALRLWAAGHLNKAREVTASGPYRLLSHPLYVGSSVMGVGLALASDSIAVALIVLAYLVGTIGAAIRTEEAFLRRAFGDRYDTYQRGAGDVAKLDAARRFDVRQLLRNREHRTVAGLVLAVLLLFLKALVRHS